jgi:hypothetical protein
VAGEEAGKLDAAFDSICRDSGEAVVSLLTGFQPLFLRIVAGVVIFSIVFTIRSLALLRG